MSSYTIRSATTNTATQFHYQQHDLSMILEAAATFLALVCVLPAFFNYIEHRQYWTARLRISCLVPWRLLTLTTIGAAIVLLYTVSGLYDVRQPTIRIAVAATLTGFAFLTFRFLLPLADSRTYVFVRWKAWTGPSRTGIPLHMTRYLGDTADWRALARSVQVSSALTEPHPAECFLRVLFPFRATIDQDPTTLLAARLAENESTGTQWQPSSEAMRGVYAPIHSNVGTGSVSLLWGESTGFTPRCSRGIIAVPLPYLSHRPTLENGLDARPLCIAHGIVARNKGLNPRSLICNLKAKNTFRVFEQNSVLWPRPAKTLRSYYEQEFSKSFSGLGEAYVTATTELALLIADASYHTLLDWLQNTLEHQDLDLNRQVNALNADDDTLDTLYRVQYAAMLVSLSLHRRGIRLRPELSCFEALWQLEHGDRADRLPNWLADETLEVRRREEQELLGVRGVRLIESVI